MIAPEHNDPPTLYGHSLPKHEQVQHPLPPAHPGPTPLDYFKEFNALMIAAVVPIVLAYIGYRTVKAKTEANNRKRRQRYAEENRLAEYSDDTIVDFLKKRKKDE